MMTEPWTGAFPGFRIFGNLYFVGTVPASTHVVDTGDGLLLFDTGYQQSLYLVLYNLQKLGLNPDDIRYILHTHGHIDHFGATKALQQLTGAKTVIGKPDEAYANGQLDLSYAKELGMTFTETFQPDILLQDGDTLTLGNTTVRCMATPGHTPGAMSYFFNATDGEQSCRCGLCGGTGINTMCRQFLDSYGLSYDCRGQFTDAMDRIAGQPVDIFLGNHMQHNDTPGKYQRLCAGQKDAFINPAEWAAYCAFAKQTLQELIEQENR